MDHYYSDELNEGTMITIKPKKYIIVGTVKSIQLYEVQQYDHSH